MYIGCCYHQRLGDDIFSDFLTTIPLKRAPGGQSQLPSALPRYYDPDSFALDDPDIPKGAPTQVVFQRILKTNTFVVVKAESWTVDWRRIADARNNYEGIIKNNPLKMKLSQMKSISQVTNSEKNYANIIKCKFGDWAVAGGVAGISEGQRVCVFCWKTVCNEGDHGTEP